MSDCLEFLEPAPDEIYWRRKIEAVKELMGTTRGDELSARVAELLGDAFRHCDFSRSVDFLTQGIAELIDIDSLRVSVWKWLLEQAKTTDGNLRAYLRIAVFESVIEEPVDDLHLSLMFEGLKIPEAHWLFEQIYEKTPAKFYEHFCRVLFHLEQTGVVKPVERD